MIPADRAAGAQPFLGVRIGFLFPSGQDGRALSSFLLQQQTWGLQVMPGFSFLIVIGEI